MAIIETERLYLRPLVIGDADFIAHEIGNYNVSKNLARVPFPYRYSDALEFLDWIKSFDHRSLVCGLELKAKSQLIGIISYEFSPSQNNAEMGYWLAESHWGQRFGSEAARAIVQHAFTATALDELVAGFHVDNPASGRILKNLGFVETDQVEHFSKAQNKSVATKMMKLTRAAVLAP